MVNHFPLMLETISSDWFPLICLQQRVLPLWIPFTIPMQIIRKSSIYGCILTVSNSYGFAAIFVTLESDYTLSMLLLTK